MMLHDVPQKSIMSDVIILFVFIDAVNEPQPPITFTNNFFRHAIGHHHPLNQTQHFFNPTMRKRYRLLRDCQSRNCHSLLPADLMKRRSRTIVSSGLDMLESSLRTCCFQRKLAWRRIAVVKESCSFEVHQEWNA